MVTFTAIAKPRTAYHGWNDHPPNRRKASAVTPTPDQIARAEKCAEAVCYISDNGDGTWDAATPTNEATTKNLCNAIRAATQPTGDTK